MYVVINIDPGNKLTELLAFMTQQTITFSVTDELSKLCDGRGLVRHETSTQTDELESILPLKLAKMLDGSSCPTMVPSEPTMDVTSTLALTPPSRPPANGNKRKKANDWDVETAVLKSLLKSELPSTANTATESSVASSILSIKEELEEGSAEDEMSNEFVQNQLLQALFPNTEIDDQQELIHLDEEDSFEVDSQSHFPLGIPNNGESVPVARFKPQYMSSKRGVCQVCNREISLIATHRRRHAVTHLGFKTLQCPICHKFFSRQDLASPHFRKDHPRMEFRPFVDTMTNEDEKQLALMMTQCFPEEKLVSRGKGPQKSLK